MSTLVQDVRYGVRMLLRTPGFTVVTILVLALGIGANSAIFSVVNAVLLRPLPYHQPERLYLIHQINAKGQPNGVPVVDLLAYATQSGALERVGFSRWINATITGPEGAENMFGAKASSELFRTLGVQPAVGRGFRDDEFRPGSPAAVILSYRLWERRFGLNPNVVGRELMLNGEAHTITGVMPRDFFYDRRYEFWTPWRLTGADQSERENRVPGVVRLKPGVKVEQASAETEPIFAHAAPQAFAKGERLRFTPVHEHVTANSRTALLTLLGAVGFVLLIACMNVANLLTARGADRARELSIRAALGAGKARIFRQVLTESVLLSAAGGAAGLLMGWGGATVLLRFFPERMPIARLEHTRMDGTVLIFTLCATLATGIVFGLVPAWQASRAGLGETLKATTRTAGAGVRLRALRNGMIVVETALSLILLTGAGLLLRSFDRMMSAERGFNADRVLTLRVPVPAAISERPRQMDYCARFVQHVSAMPGLAAAGVVAPLPLAGVDANATFFVEGRPSNPDERTMVKLRTASPDFFTALGVPLLRGRVFTEMDTADAPGVAVVSESLARRFFPNEDALGRRVAFSEKGPWITVVGVVRDVKHTTLTADFAPELYRPYRQYIFAPFATTLVVRTAGSDPEALAAALQKHIRDFNPDQPVNDVLPMPEVVSRAAAQPRFYTMLLGVFAVISVVLAAAGLYGVLGYAVSQRTREIGVRVALGAPVRAILGSVVGHALAVVGAGVAAGVAGAMALTRFLQSQLYGVTATDPMTYSAVAALLVVVAGLAAWAPARRAMKVDPVIALRCE